MLPGWHDCATEMFPEETPPNIHPLRDTPFGVTQSAADRGTYLGMVVRENGTWESISQKLLVPIQADRCYAFRLKMCQWEILFNGHKEMIIRTIS